MGSTGSAAPRATSTVRLGSVDTLRGIVMILMALDHVRDFFGVPGVNPVSLAQTTAPLFLTRVVTHICAPTFFLLTGTGAWLSRKPTPALSRYLLTRGLWLLVLEVTVLRCLGYQFNADYQVTLLLVLWALGWAMIALAALVWLPLPAVLVFGIALVAGHNVFDGVRSAHPLWNLLHAPGFVVNRPGFVVFVAYPLIPWIGVTALGYVAGRIYDWAPARRRGFLTRWGLGLTAAFVVPRWLNVYGDPAPWSVQVSAAMTLVSFFNTTKYPPSLLFLLMTLGPALLLLWSLDRGVPRLLAPATVFGRVPLFYFVLHFFVIHALAVVVCLAVHGSAHWMFESPDLANYPFTPPPDWGFSLPTIYAVWLAVVVVVYPVCVWYAGVKRRGTSWWLSYL